MANNEREHNAGFVDIRRVQNDTAGVLATSGTYDNTYTLRTYLAASTAHGAGFYTSARMDNMTKNDLVYAARLIQDAAGVK